MALMTKNGNHIEAVETFSNRLEDNGKLLFDTNLLKYRIKTLLKI